MFVMVFGIILHTVLRRRENHKTFILTMALNKDYRHPSHRWHLTTTQNSICRRHQVVTIDGTDDQCSFWIHHDIHVFPQSIHLHTHTPARTHTHAVIPRRLLKCNRLDRIKRTLVPRSTIPTLRNLRKRSNNPLVHPD